MWVTEVNWSLDADEKFTYFDKQAEYDSRMAVLYRADWSGVVAIVKVSVEVGAVQPVIQLMINPTVPDQENINKGARQIELTVVTKDEQVVVVGTGISLRLVPPLKKASGKALIYLPSPFAVWTP